MFGVYAARAGLSVSQLPSQAEMVASTLMPTSISVSTYTLICLNSRSFKKHLQAMATQLGNKARKHRRREAFSPRIDPWKVRLPIVAPRQQFDLGDPSQNITGHSQKAAASSNQLNLAMS